MARIAEEEIERIKREIDLVALVQSKGIELSKHGSKDLKGLSPFTDEKSPSFIITPHKNVWNCLSSGKGGSVIDFVMHFDGISFRHAYEVLANGSSKAFVSKQPVRRSKTPKLEAPISLEAEDHQLMVQTVDYYHERLQQSPNALEYLQKRGITEEAIKYFKLGYADRTLGLRLPQKQTKSGAEIRERLEKLGLYRKSGHEHFNGCVVFPVMQGSNGSTKVTEIYGRKTVNKQKTGVYHLYLPGPHEGIFNRQGLIPGGEVILTESIIDALTFWCHGIKNVTCIYGTGGFTQELEDTLIELKTQRVYLAYDRDESGDRAAKRDADRLGALGIECLRVNFPHGMDANSYSLKVTPASKSLQLLLNSAEWICGKGSALPHKSQESLPPLNNNSSLAANVSGSSEKAAKEKNDVGEKRAVSEPTIEGDDITFEFGERTYRVRGLHKNTSPEVMKINLRVMCNDLFHIDALDLYQSKQRRIYIDEASKEVHLQTELIKRDLGKLLLKLEELRDQKAEETALPDEVEMSEEEREEAMEYLKDPNLLDRILDDFDRCGIVGERTNKLTGYLAATSRKLKRPLAVIIQSTSAAGKTSLMEAVLNMMPEEERIKYSAMTGQSLYYLGETNLKHKILAIVEEEGAEKASYALKLLQSEGELTIASTGKDDQGRMKTEEYHVEGPVMIFLTTTAIEIDEELLNRCLILTVDESREQTEKIHQMQREAETFEGLKRDLEAEKVLRIHRNAQRLLKPWKIANDYAPKLTFLSDRTRTRRDHTKYLTLIKTIALLHQYQRKPVVRDGIEHIAVTIEDIRAANAIAHEVLGRSLDELPPQTRKLLEALKELVKAKCEENGIEQSQCWWTRRDVRKKTGWSEFQVRVHLQKLEELEYIERKMGRQGTGCVYELLYPMDHEEGTFVLGLTDVEKLEEGK